MDSTLTLIGSIVIGSIFLLNVFSFYGGVTSHSQEKYLELRTQETAVSMMEIIEHDFRRIGTGVETPSQSIDSITDSTDITFWGDIDFDGTAEEVQYHFSDKAAAAGTDNPNDVILYRVIGGVTEPYTVGVSDSLNLPGLGNFVRGFSFRLYGYEFVGGQWKFKPTTDWLNASSIEVRLIVQSMIGYTKTSAENKYTTVILKKFITPEALIRPSGIDYN